MDNWQHPDDRRFDRLVDSDSPIRMVFLHPGTVFQDGQLRLHSDLPAGVAVMITKEGQEEARTVVRRGDDTWEVSENSLVELPEDLRGHVRSWMSGPQRFGVTQRLDGHRRSARFLQRMESMQEQLDELRQSVEGLHSESGQE